MDEAFLHELKQNPKAVLHRYGQEVAAGFNLNTDVSPSLEDALGTIRNLRTQTAAIGVAGPGSAGSGLPAGGEPLVVQRYGERFRCL